MKTLEELTINPLKHSPDVWVRRVVIISKLTPKPAIIRDIPLRRGLNIVWAEEPESDTDTSDIAGHSAGKTSFCRLIRYVLGEKTFANKGNTQVIKKSFPNGYVAAEINIKDSVYAVLRPLGDNRNSYIRKNAKIEDLWEYKGDAAYQDDYPQKLGLDALLDNLASATVVRTNETIKWGHLLAWCTRDQEARFQNIHDWRSPRSESEWPAFRFPKADPLFVMRITLGLFLPDELKAEESLSGDMRSLEKAEADLEKAKREPDFWFHHHNNKLRTQLKACLPGDGVEIDTAPIVSETEITYDIKRFVEKAKYFLTDETAKQELEADKIQIQLDELNEGIASARSEHKQLNALFAHQEKIDAEETSGLKRNEQTLAKITEYSDRTCPLGDVLFGNCNYIQSRQNALKGTLVKDAHALEQAEARQAEARNKLQTQCATLQQRVQELEIKRTGLTKEQNRLRIQIADTKSKANALDYDFSETVIWRARLDKPESYDKLSTTMALITKLRDSIDRQLAALNALLAKHEGNRALLNSIFSATAKKVLPSSAYDGVVSFRERELNFQITHGGAMTGEAMETLAVLMADISCLIYNSLSNDSNLPGFLLHDSPREADLGLRHYYSYIRFAAWLDEYYRKGEGCPFQYILTTTTSPPAKLRDGDIIALKLDASTESGLLFQRNLSRPPEDEQMGMLPLQ
jgi:hypothetical protein